MDRVSQTDGPQVSVITAVYNGEQYIAEALDSVFAQTLLPMEVIVVDDGSTDRTVDLVRERFGAKVKLIECAHRGVAAARNAGVEASRGTYLAVIDADDIWEAEHLTRLAAALEADPSASLAFCGYVVIDKDGVCWCPTARGAGPPHTLERLVLNNFIVSPSMTLIRRDTLVEAGSFDEHLPGNGADDWDVYIRLLLGRRIAFVPEALTRYRRHPGNNLLQNQNLLISELAVLNKLFANDKARRLLARSRRYYLARRYAASMIRMFYLHRSRRKAAYWMIRAVLAHPAALWLPDVRLWVLKFFVGSRPYEWLCAVARRFRARSARGGPEN